MVAFVLNRGVAVLPDDVGRTLGWQRLEDGAHSDAGQAKVEANLSTGDRSRRPNTLSVGCP